MMDQTRGLKFKMTKSASTNIPKQPLTLKTQFQAIVYVAYIDYNTDFLDQIGRLGRARDVSSWYNSAMFGG